MEGSSPRRPNAVHSQANSGANRKIKRRYGAKLRGGEFKAEMLRSITRSANRVMEAALCSKQCPEYDGGHGEQHQHDHPVALHRVAFQRRLTSAQCQAATTHYGHQAEQVTRRCVELVQHLPGRTHTQQAAQVDGEFPRLGCRGGFSGTVRLVLGSAWLCEARGAARLEQG